MKLRTMSPIALALVLASLLTSLPANAAQTTPVERIIDVVQVSWANAPASTVTAAQVEQNVRQDIIDRWLKVSNGQIRFTFGQQLTPVSSDAPLGCDGASGLTFMTTMRTAAYTKTPVAGSATRYLLMLVPAPAQNCVWDGRGTVGNPTSGGTVLLKDTADVSVIAHELGHNLGLGHSNLETCSSGKPDGKWTDCMAIEYGSATDLMSNNDRTSPLAVYHQWRLGLVADDDIVDARTTRDVPLASASSVTGVRGVFVRDQSAAYWVEFRQADPANQINAGLVIYRTDQAPSTAVVSPVVRDSPTYSGGVTSDVWMINLGNYAYDTYGGNGSPSLPAGTSFTTAYGGATISATIGADNVARVRIQRTADTTPPLAPTLTDSRQWTAGTAELTTSTELDAESGVTDFEVKVFATAGDRVVKVPSVASRTWTRNALNPVTAPRTLTLAQLPEGTQAFALRAVDAAGNASAWTTRALTSVDRQPPVLEPTFAVAPNSSDAVSVRWTGARDSGVGVCTARVVNGQGFAVAKWTSDTPGEPRWILSNSGTLRGLVQAFDCQGNGLQGDLTITAMQTPAGKWTLGPGWTGSASQRTCRNTCSASTMVDGSTGVFVGAGSASVYVDGKLARNVAASRSTKARVALRLQGAHRVRVVAKNLTLIGAQSVVAQLGQTRAVQRQQSPVDVSLIDDAQVELAGIGFSQSDFTDDFTVLPMGLGTTLEQPSLDFCSDDYQSERDRVLRRQVYVQRRSESPYRFISSETVRYSSSTTQAVTELDAAIARCKSAGGYTNRLGVFVPYVIQEVVATTTPSGINVRQVLTTIGSGADTVTLLAVYQFRGTLMNNLYVVNTDGIGDPAKTEWLQVAERLRQRML